MARRRVPIRQSGLVARFAARLREVRLSRGMTQADLARAAQVSPAYVSRLESGAVAPGIDLVERVAAALGASAASLLPDAGPADPLPALRDQAVRMLGELVRAGDAEALARLNPVLALLLESAARRGRPAADSRGPGV